jgi:hypothetical protein
MKCCGWLFILCLAGLSLSIFAAGKVQVSGAKVTEVGIYKTHVATDYTNAAGVKLRGIDEFKLVHATTNVPARIGVCFGFRYVILGEPKNAPIMLTMVGKHPPIKNAKTGKVETEDRYPLQSWIGNTYTSNSLDDESELVPGKWTFEVWHEGKKLCEQSFMVVVDEGLKGNR